MLRSIVLVLALVSLPLIGSSGFADEPERKVAGKDRERLQGDWAFTSYIVDGSRAPDDVLKKAVVSFRDEKMAVKPMPISSIDAVSLETTWRAEGEFTAAFELGAMAKARTIDLIVGEGKEAFRLKGIYSLDGDELRICYSLSLSTPTAFESKTGSRNRLLALKRVKR
jgi:uncharacterized protein (TIGR03067 family)